MHFSLHASQPQPARDADRSLCRTDRPSAADAALDRDLMRRIQGREVAALERLYDRHHAVAFGLACKIVRDRGLAEDIVQDAFLTLWRQPERFDPARGTARGWLLAIVHHRGVDRLRRARTSGHVAQLTSDIAAGDADPCERAVERIQSAQLLGALAQLPADQRRTIELAYLHGRTHREIAALMDCPLGTVKGRIRIGLGKLRALAPAAGLSPA